MDSVKRFLTLSHSWIWVSRILHFWYESSFYLVLLLRAKLFLRGKQCMWRGLNNEMETSSGARTWRTETKNTFWTIQLLKRHQVYIISGSKERPGMIYALYIVEMMPEGGWWYVLVDDGSKQARSSHLKCAPLLTTKTAPPLDIDETAEANIWYMHKFCFGRI